jgi:hypothetical protein
MLMTQADYARHRKVGKPAVSNWKKAGLLVLAEDPATGRIMVDRDRTDARLNAKIDPMRGRPPTASAAGPAAAPPPDAAPPPAAPVEPSIADERQLHLREQRTGQALKNAQMAGELVPLVEAERRLSEAGRAARERIQAWFRGLAERLAAERDQRTIMALGEEGIDKVFAELAAGAERGDFAADDDPGLTADETAELLASAGADE